MSCEDESGPVKRSWAVPRLTSAKRALAGAIAASGLLAMGRVAQADEQVVLRVHRATANVTRVDDQPAGSVSDLQGPHALEPDYFPPTSVDGRKVIVRHDGHVAFSADANGAFRVEWEHTRNDVTFVLLTGDGQPFLRALPLPGSIAPAWSRRLDSSVLL